MDRTRNALPRQTVAGDAHCRRNLQLQRCFYHNCWQNPLCQQSDGFFCSVSDLADREPDLRVDLKLSDEARGSWKLD
jgi:hypothetical protein